MEKNKNDYNAVLYLRPDLLYSKLDMKSLKECMYSNNNIIFTPNFINGAV